MDCLASLLLALLVIVVLVLAVLYLSSWPVQHTFRDMGVETPATNVLLGHLQELLRLGLFGVQTQFYNQFKGKKVYGWYDFRKPTLYVRDLDLVREVCLKSASHFADRPLMFDIQPPFHETLICLSGEHWKKVRHSTSPAFSSSRLKKMLRHIERKVENLIKVLDQLQERNEPAEMKEKMGRLTIDTIATMAFGLDINTLTEPDNEFYHNAVKLTKPSVPLVLINTLYPVLGQLLGKMGFSVISKSTMDYFEKVVDAAIAVRKESGHAGKIGDFLDLVLNEDKDGREALTRSEICSQAVVFIFGGYDTVSAVLAFTLFLLAVHPEHQTRVQEELDSKLQHLKGDVPGYDDIQDLPYLEQCMNEAMRLYPPGIYLDRKCTEEITLQDIKIPKGMAVIVPTFAIHRDPEIFEEPDEFRPERFSAENKESIPPFAFSPFGQGPRACLGMRLALLELRLVLATVIRRYEILPCEKTVYPINLSKMNLIANDGLWVKMERRKI